MTGMTTNRKVRKDFDPTKEYSVDVSNCTEDEKKKVQQAFFDAGFPWKVGGKKYQHLDDEQYTNTTGDGHVTKFCMFSWETKECNMTAEEFLDLVYEPVQQGHVHADLMALYAEDAKTTDKPWELWQTKTADKPWGDLKRTPEWDPRYLYRRKPKTHTVHGVEVPDLRFEPNEGEEYYLAEPTEYRFTYKYTATNDNLDTVWAERGLCYKPTEEGKKAAILHAKAMLGMIQE